MNDTNNIKIIHAPYLLFHQLILKFPAIEFNQQFYTNCRVWRIIQKEVNDMKGSDTQSDFIAAFWILYTAKKIEKISIRSYFVLIPPPLHADIL